MNGKNGSKLRTCVVLLAVCAVMLTAGCGNSAVSADGVAAPVLAEASLSPPVAAPVPTASPTPVPTAAPTPEPTQRPISKPTPTAEPTPDPAPEPAPDPTPAPTPVAPGDIVLPEQIISPWADAYTGGEDNKKYAWYLNKNKAHQPPGAQRAFDIRAYDAYYLGDIEKQAVYLTFDEGYEIGHTARILDILKEKDVPAAFFVTGHYIRSCPDLVRRMADEGHVVANHTLKHPSLPDCADEDVMRELAGVETLYNETTGYVLDRFMRPPSGEYSPRVLGIAQRMEYKTVFWSIAHQDWLVNDQPEPAQAYNAVMDHMHNGAVILLHAVSSANTEALADMIDGIRGLGFTFASLYELP